MESEHLAGGTRLASLADIPYTAAYPSVPSELNLRKTARQEGNNRGRLHFKPIPTLIGELNRQLKGWANYFSLGYPLSAYCEIERYVRDRLMQHLERRSQRPYRPPEGESWLRQLGRLGLVRLSELVHA